MTQNSVSMKGTWDFSRCLQERLLAQYFRAEVTSLPLRAILWKNNSSLTFSAHLWLIRISPRPIYVSPTPPLLNCYTPYRPRRLTHRRTPRLPKPGSLQFLHEIPLSRCGSCRNRFHKRHSLILPHSLPVLALGHLSSYMTRRAKSRNYLARAENPRAPISTTSGAPTVFRKLSRHTPLFARLTIRSKPIFTLTIPSAE